MKHISKKYFLLTILFIIIIGGVVSLFFYLQKEQKRHALFHFSQEQFVNYRNLSKEIELSIESLESIKDMFQASDNVSKEQFNALATSVIKRHPLFQAIEWIPKIKGSDRSELKKVFKRIIFLDLP